MTQQLLDQKEKTLKWMVFSHHHETCNISYRYMILNSGYQAQFQHAYTDKCSNYNQAYHISSLQLPLTPHKIPQTPSFKGNDGPTPLKAWYPSRPAGRCIQFCGLHNKNNIGPCQSVQAAVTTFYGEGGDKYSREQSWEASQLPQCNTFMGAGLSQLTLMSAGKQCYVLLFVLLFFVII